MIRIMIQYIWRPLRTACTAKKIATAMFRINRIGTNSFPSNWMAEL